MEKIPEELKLKEWVSAVRLGFRLPYIHGWSTGIPGQSLMFVS
jgi:hypothetical protein